MEEIVVVDESKDSIPEQKSIFAQLKERFKRQTKVKCFLCGNIWKIDTEAADTFLAIQKAKSIDEAIKKVNIVCPKCGGNRWVYVAKKRWFKLDFPKINFDSLIDVFLWFLAWIEFRRMIMLRNWWIDFRNVICRGGAILALLATILIAKQAFHIEFYQVATTVVVLYAIIKFSRI